MKQSAIRLANMSADVYYAPQMVALDAGFFADEGLAVEVLLVETAQVPAAVAVGEAEVALSGMWQPWLYTERMQTPFRVFAQLNQQVPLLLFAREADGAFDWRRLEGGSILHTSVIACSPWIAVEGLLRHQGVDRGRLGLLEGFPPEEALPLFKAGLGEVAEVFLGAEALPWLADPELRRVVEWEADLGRIPWSVYFTAPAVLERMQPQLVAFTRALGRGQAWLREHDAGEAAALLAHRFPQLDEAGLATLIATFAADEQWPSAPALQLDSCERWRSILGAVGLLAPGLPVDELVAAGVAAEAAG